MTITMQPALTAEEWERLQVIRIYPSKVDPDDDRGGYTFELEDGGVLSVDAHWPDASPEILPADRHALAALALHGQPFGFTREDVKLLADTCAWLDGYVRSLNTPVDRYETPLHALAAKIAALLPPA